MPSSSRRLIAEIAVAAGLVIALPVIAPAVLPIAGAQPSDGGDAGTDVAGRPDTRAGGMDTATAAAATRAEEGSAGEDAANAVIGSSRASIDAGAGIDGSVADANRGAAAPTTRGAALEAGRSTTHTVRVAAGRVPSTVSANGYVRPGNASGNASAVARSERTSSASPVAGGARARAAGRFGRQ
jgi:hypothetical protein